MKLQKNKYAVSDDNPVFDPFPEPRTMPEGWDLSVIILNQVLPSSKTEPIPENAQINPQN